MGLFIAFEGPDGSGKSTQARRLAAWLRARGYPVTETHEPGGTSLGDRVRDIILDPGGPPATALATSFLLSASRTQLVEEVIQPALARAEIVIADRYADSTIAYQSWGGGVPIDLIRQLTAIATGGLRPDLVVYVDVPAEVGMARVQARGKANRLDAEALEFHRRVRTGYQTLIDQEPDRWAPIDGTQSCEEVERRIRAAVLTRIERVAGVI